MLLLTAAVSELDLSGIELSVWDVLLRLLCALVVGAVIGTEREYTHRPAGMRTHMLVSLGACAVMVTSQMIFAQYRPYGATPDPARLSAQVITGVGFLGAGTIMREGPTVKGLTTAASLWAVACLGVAAGGGYYLIALAGMGFIFITLTIFERFQKHLLGAGNSSFDYHLQVNNLTDGLRTLNQEALNVRATIKNIEAEQVGNSKVFRISFRADFDGPRVAKRKQKFFERMTNCESVVSMHTVGDFSGEAAE